MKKTIVLCSAIALGPVAAIHAQKLEPGLERLNGAVTKLLALEAKVVKGLPYSAEVVTESIQTLADGNRIVQRTTGRVFRDSQGRVRREEDRPAGSPAISIMDPIAGVSISLDPATRTARETSNGPAIEITKLVEELQLKRLDAEMRMKKLDVVIRREPGNKLDGQIEEKLQDHLIEGVLASGIRRTTTIPSGAIGNEQPITIVSEEWTSPDLQILVMTDRLDPRMGHSTYRLLKIVRSDPDPALFQVPVDYTLQQAPGRGGLGPGAVIARPH